MEGMWGKVGEEKEKENSMAGSFRCGLYSAYGLCGSAGGDTENARKAGHAGG